MIMHKTKIYTYFYTKGTRVQPNLLKNTNIIITGYSRQSIKCLIILWSDKIDYSITKLCIIKSIYAFKRHVMIATFF